MKPRLLVAGALAVVIALAGLWWSATRPGPTPPAAPSLEPVAAAPETPSPPRDLEPGAPRPVRPTPDQEATAAPPVGTTVTRADGTPVHDQRGVRSTRGRSPFAQPTVDLLLGSAEAPVKKCAEPMVARGQKTRLTATLSLKIEAGKIRVEKTQVDVESLDDPDLVACIQAAMGQLVLDAPAGQGDTEYRISLPYSVP